MFALPWHQQALKGKLLRLSLQKYSSNVVGNLGEVRVDLWLDMSVFASE